MFDHKPAKSLKYNVTFNRTELGLGGCGKKLIFGINNKLMLFILFMIYLHHHALKY